LRIKRVTQHDQIDCGAASFATILNTYGDHITLARARAMVHTSKKGSTLLGLVEAARKQKFVADGLSGTLEELIDLSGKKEIVLPCIAHIVTSENLSHFIIIYKIKKKHLVIFDTGSGDRKMDFAEFEKLWDGLLVNMYPGENWTPLFPKRFSFRKYIDIISQVKAKIFLTIIVSFVISAISIAGSLLYKEVIDGFIMPDRLDTSKVSDGNVLQVFFQEIISHIDYLFISVLILYLFQALLSLLRTYFIAELSVRSGKTLFLNLFKKLMKLPANFFYNRESGDLLARFQVVSEFQEHLSEIIISIFLEAFTALAGGYVLFRISPHLFGITCLLVLSYLAVTLIFIKPLKKINSKVIDANSATLTVYTQSISGIEEIKMLNAAPRFIDSFKKRVENLLNIGKSGIILQNIQMVLVFLLESLGVVLILWSGSLLVLKDVLTLGSLVSFETLIVYFVYPLKNIIEKQKEIQDLFVMANKLDDIFEVESEKIESEVEFPKLAKTILSLEDISFSYGASLLILENLEMVFESGNHYAISGRSGIGKTSLLKMIASLVLPDAGRITLNNLNINENYQQYRQYISYLPNNPTLFAGTIRENLMLGNQHVSETELFDIVTSIGLGDLLETLPDGMEAKILENGLNFSSGQKQRIAIARALVHSPKILLLDEALSNLDRESQVLIMSVVNERMSEKILISISHDAELNKFANQILKIEDKKLVREEVVNCLEQKQSVF